MRRLCFLLFLLPALALLLVGCSIRTVASVTVKNGSFREDYAVDEALDLSNALLVVTYDKGEEVVAIEPDMVTGFDTSTTGNKTLTVAYKDKTTMVSYRVYNPENASKSVVTTARLALFADVSDAFAEYTVHYSAGDLPNARAISFSLKSAYTLGIDAACDNLTVLSDFKSASYKCALSEDGGTLKVVLFTMGTPFPVGGVLAKFRVEGGNNRSVGLSDIVLSDGADDYYLPPVNQ